MHDSICPTICIIIFQRNSGLCITYTFYSDEITNNDHTLHPSLAQDLCSTLGILMKPSLKLCYVIGYF